MRATARTAYEEFVQIGDRWGMSSCLLVLGRLATLDGRIDQAIEHHDEAMRQLRALGGSEEDEVYVAIRVADLYARKGDFAAARRQLTRTDDTAGRAPRSGDRDLFGDAALVTLDWLVDDRAGALTRARRLRARLADRGPLSSVSGHVSAVGLGIAGAMEAVSGHLEAAYADLEQAYPAAVGTGDMPILATVGLSVCVYAVALGRLDDAAMILGAAAQVRDADDPTDPSVIKLTTQLSAELTDFAASYGAGRSLDRAQAIARLDPGLLRQAQESEGRAQVSSRGGLRRACGSRSGPAARR